MSMQKGTVYQLCSDRWTSWKYVEEMAEQIGVPTAPLIERVEIGSYLRLKEVLTGIAERVIAKGHEGIIVRVAGEFSMGEFGNSVAKYVRPNHVQTDDHWRRKPVVPNELKQLTTAEGGG